MPDYLVRNLDHYSPASAAHIEHPSHAGQGIHAFPDRLHVLTVVSNPLRWRSRYENYWKFEAHVASSPAVLYTAEIVQGDRMFEVTTPDNPRNLQLRTWDELWHKENALNLLLARVPLGAQYIAMVDADLIFTRPDWAQETLHLLQHYQIIQMFSHLIDINQDGQPVNQSPAVSMVYQRTQDIIPRLEGAQKKKSLVADAYDYLHAMWTGERQKPGTAKRPWGCPGGAWAYRKDALNQLGGLMDFSIIGSADWYMAKALFGEVEEILDPRWHNNYKMLCREWQNNAAALQKDIGYMKGTVLHLWHGAKSDRGYGVRVKQMADTHFDPLHDIRRDWQGLYQLTGSNTDLRDWIRERARMRNEDADQVVQ